MLSQAIGPEKPARADGGKGPAAAVPPRGANPKALAGPGPGKEAPKGAEKPDDAKKRKLPPGWVDMGARKKEAAKLRAKGPAVPVLQRRGTVQKGVGGVVGGTTVVAAPKAKAKLKSDPVPFVALPYEVLLQVFSYLMPHQCLRVRRLCRTAAGVADDPTLWHSLDLTGVPLPGRSVRFLKPGVVPVISDAALAALAERIAARAKAESVPGFRRIRLARFGALEPSGNGVPSFVSPSTARAVFGGHAPWLETVVLDRPWCFGERHWQMMVPAAGFPHLTELRILADPTDKGAHLTPDVVPLLAAATHLRVLHVHGTFATGPYSLPAALLDSLNSLSTNSSAIAWNALRPGRPSRMLSLRTLELTDCRSIGQPGEVAVPENVERLTMHRALLDGADLRGLVGRLRRLRILDVSRAEDSMFAVGGIGIEHVRAAWKAREAEREKDPDGWAALERIVWADGKVYRGK
ncbi:hypothetical protein DFJ74DRAFT_663133 [Hyaloraphidium curvatum]|nr:hypothetical protein DFJ74DRAFT_663133 [Hyaloraphidium curvatum]